MTAMRLVFLGLSLTSSWGNGQVAAYRGLLRELARRGHEVLFLARDEPYYAANRDLPAPGYASTALYGTREELEDRFASAIRCADAVVIASHVPEGAAIGDWVCETARGVRVFYDTDTSTTLRALAAGGAGYILPRQVRGYDLYLSFTGGPTLRRLAREYGASRARALYPSVDPEVCFPSDEHHFWDLGYIGNHCAERQPALAGMLMGSAGDWPDGRFVVAGSRYPADVRWPGNVEHIPHVSAADHRSFYNRQRFALNVTRENVSLSGWAPSVRLFEAAACGTPVISDIWWGVDQFFAPEEEILLARSSVHVLAALRGMPEEKRRAVGARARRRVLSEHTSAHRAETFEGYIGELAAPHHRAPRGRGAAAFVHEG